MATWTDVNRLVDMLGGTHLSDTFDRIVIPGCQPEREQRVYLAYEVMQPDFEFLKITSAFAMIDRVNVQAIVQRVGRMQVGCISYQYVRENGNEVDGFITLASTTPLASLDLANKQEHFCVYLNIFGRAADSLEMESAESGQPDFF